MSVRLLLEFALGAFAYLAYEWVARRSARRKVDEPFFSLPNVILGGSHIFPDGSMWRHTLLTNRPYCTVLVSFLIIVFVMLSIPFALRCSIVLDTFDSLSSVESLPAHVVVPASSPVNPASLLRCPKPPMNKGFVGFNSTSENFFLKVALKRQRMDTSQADGSVYHRSAYFGSLSIGAPAQHFSVVFDTGSGQLLLPSAYCHSETCRAHRRYRRSASLSSRDIDFDGSVVAPDTSRDQISVAFGTGEVTGVLVEDVVCLGTTDVGAEAVAASLQQTVSGASTKTPPPCLREQCIPFKFVAATDMSEHPFKTFEFDGVLGLGLAGLSQASGFNYLEALMSSFNSESVNAPYIFGVFLASSSNEESEITFGGWNQERLVDAESLSWTSVLEPEHGHWMVRVKSIKIDGQVLDYCQDGCRAVVDTGTSLLAVPSDIFTELYSALRHPAVDDLSRPGRKSCRSGSGPRFDIELEGLTVKLEAPDFARIEKDAATQQPICRPTLMTMDLPKPLGPKLFILGEPVLRRYYTVYDAKAKRVGFGLAAQLSGETEDDDSNDFHDDQRMLDPPSVFNPLRWTNAFS